MRVPVEKESLIVELLAEGRLTGMQIARRVGVSHYTVYRISDGRRRPDLSATAKAAERAPNQRRRLTALEQEALLARARAEAFRNTPEGRAQHAAMESTPANESDLVPDFTKLPDGAASRAFAIRFPK
ncbi:MAG: helix-turn-helix domain-containing protein [Planctomycetaceae bacterium]|nr:helix-turn-helix domain-containing protein [Planctomycetaceae bacterium]